MMTHAKVVYDSGIILDKPPKRLYAYIVMKIRD